MTLSDYLKKTGQTPYSFFKKHGLPRDPVYRYLRGAGVKYETAEAISEATCGEVSIAEIMKRERANA